MTLGPDVKVHQLGKTLGLSTFLELMADSLETGQTGFDANFGENGRPGLLSQTHKPFFITDPATAKASDQ